MAITIGANVKGAEATSDDARTEDVFLIDEGPYPFTYPPMGKLQGAELRVRGIKDQHEREQILTGVMLEWLERGFGPAAWERITERIESDTDPLGIPHLVATYTGLVSAHAGRPTTSSNGASPSPWAKISTDAPSPVVSDSVTSVPVTSAT
jgi:hypothetical protein